MLHCEMYTLPSPQNPFELQLSLTTHDRLSHAVPTAPKAAPPSCPAPLIGQAEGEGMGRMRVITSQAGAATGARSSDSSCWIRLVRICCFQGKNKKI